MLTLHLLKPENQRLLKLCALGAGIVPAWSWPCWQLPSSQEGVDELHTKE